MVVIITLYHIVCRHVDIGRWCPSHGGMNYTTTKYFTVTREYFTYIISTYITDYKYEIMSNIFLSVQAYTRSGRWSSNTPQKQGEDRGARENESGLLRMSHQLRVLNCVRRNEPQVVVACSDKSSPPTFVLVDWQPAITITALITL